MCCAEDGMSQGSKLALSECCTSFYISISCTDHTEDGELCAVLKMACHKIQNWHYLSVDATLTEKAIQYDRSGGKFHNYS